MTQLYVNGHLDQDGFISHLEPRSAIQVTVGRGLDHEAHLQTMPRGGKDTLLLHCMNIAQ